MLEREEALFGRVIRGVSGLDMDVAFGAITAEQRMQCFRVVVQEVVRFVASVEPPQDQGVHRFGFVPESSADIPHCNSVGDVCGSGCGARLSSRSVGGRVCGLKEDVEGSKYGATGSSTHLPTRSSTLLPGAVDRCSLRSSFREDKGANASFDGSERGSGINSGFSGVNLGVRGPNYERNRVSRLRKKQRKQELDKEGNFGNKGLFFSGCSEDVKIKLRDSRAQFFIAQNELKTLEFKKKLASDSRLSSGWRRGEVDVAVAVTPPDSILSVKSGVFKSVSQTSSLASSYSVRTGYSPRRLGETKQQHWLRLEAEKEESFNQ